MSGGEGFLSRLNTENAYNGQLPPARMDSHMEGIDSQGRQEVSTLRSLPESAGDTPSAVEGGDNQYEHGRQARAYPASTLAMDWPVV
jgi:hypothetical protein